MQHINGIELFQGYYRASKLKHIPRRTKIVKIMCANFLRTSHNPFAWYVLVSLYPPLYIVNRDPDAYA